MQEITTTTVNLPDTLEDLSKFVLVAPEKIASVRAEIRAIEKIGFARDVLEQKLRERDELSEALVDAQVRVGELTREMKKSKGGRPEKTRRIDEPSFSNKKSDKIIDLGLERTQVQRFEQMANHPEAVAQAKAEAKKAGEAVTQKRCLDLIKAQKSQRDDLQVEGVAAYVAEQDERRAETDPAGGGPEDVGGQPGQDAVG